MNLRLCGFVAVVCLGWVASVEAAVASENPVRAELIADHSVIAPGQQFGVMIWLHTEPGWHTYWINPGEAGLTTQVKWNIPFGFEAGPIQWPSPEEFKTGDAVSYGYSGSVGLPVEMRAPELLASGARAQLSARVNWLACHEICVPGSAEVEMVMPVAATPKTSTTDVLRLFQSARNRIPASWIGVIRAAATKREWRLDVESDGGAAIRSARFFALDRGVVAEDRPQKFTRRAGGRSFVLQISKGLEAGAEIRALYGVLCVERTGKTGESAQCYAVDASIEEKGAGFLEGGLLSKFKNFLRW